MKAFDVQRRRDSREAASNGCPPYGVSLPEIDGSRKGLKYFAISLRKGIFFLLRSPLLHSSKSEVLCNLDENHGQWLFLTGGSRLSANSGFPPHGYSVEVAFEENDRKTGVVRDLKALMLVGNGIVSKRPGIQLNEPLGAKELQMKLKPCLSCSPFVSRQVEPDKSKLLSATG